MSSTSKVKHSEKLNKNNIFYVNIISLLMSFSGGLLIYITSAYFKTILQTSNIGWTFLIANIVILLTLLFIHKIAKTIGQNTLFHLLLIIKISLFIALALNSNSFTGIVLLISYITCEALSWVVLKMILETNATDAQTGRIFSFNLTLINTGLILAPIFATQILINSGFVDIFRLSIFLNLFIFIFAFFTLSQQRDLQVKRSKKYSNLLTKFKARPDIQKIYFISFALELFFAMMVIYTPLYLLDQNFTWQQIGFIFSLMLIPLIILPYPIGFLADKKIGEKEMIIFAFILIGTSSMFLFLLDNSTFIIILIALFISRIGASLISVLRLSYFYKRIDYTDTDMISLFNTARPVAFIIGTILTSVLLFFTQLNIVFLLITLVAIIALYTAYKLTDNSPSTN